MDISDIYQKYRYQCYGHNR